jgi:ribosomal protein S18 acetylase RimI-like enzyme
MAAGRRDPPPSSLEGPRQVINRRAINRTGAKEGVNVSEGYDLRRAIAADAAAARSLTREAYAKWVPVIGREPKPMSADFDAAIRDHRVDLLCEGERIVALIETIAEPGALLIENVAVSPSCQGRGLGRRLMAHAEGLAATLGYGEIQLYTNARFVENVAFYRRLGYAIAREEPSVGGRIVHMSKRLPPA